MLSVFSRRKQPVGPGDPGSAGLPGAAEPDTGADLDGDISVNTGRDGDVGPAADTDTAALQDTGSDGSGPVIADRVRGTRESVQGAVGAWRQSAGYLVTADGRATMGRVRGAVVLSGGSLRGTRLPAWLVAPLWVAVIGLLLSLAGIFLLSGVVPQPIWSAPVLAWLVAHQSTLITSDGSISLLPLGLTVIPVLLWARASAWLGHRFGDDRRELRRNQMLAVASYGVFGTLGALLVLPGEIRVSMLTTVVAVPAVAGLGIALSAWWRDRSPSRIPTALLGGVTVTGWFLALGTAVLMVLAIVNLSDMASARALIVQGSLDQLALFLVELAYLPNLIIWAAAYATGAGISAGGDQVFSPFTSGTTPLPDLPILAAFQPESPGWARFLPLLVVGGGFFAALVEQRRSRARNLRHRLTRTAVLVSLVAIGWLVALLLAGGSMGDGRLSYVGPAVVTPLFAAGLVGFGALLWALLPTLADDLRTLIRRVGPALRGSGPDA